MQPQPDSPQAALRDELIAELAATDAPAPASEGGDGLFVALVVDSNKNEVVIELGPRSQGVIPATEFDELPAAGAELRVSVAGREDGLWVCSISAARKLASWNELEVGSLVKGRVIGVNKGGLELKIASLDAFMPASQVALHHVEDLLSYASQTLLCEVLEIDQGKNRIVVSRRAVLQVEADETRAHTTSSLVEGSVLRGKVTRIEPFGAFVDIGGVEGLLHVSNISHKRVEHPDERLKTGEDIEVQILKIEDGGRRIGLGMKQLEADPWDVAVEKLREDELVTGKVQRMLDFGAFVELLPGVDGLLHVSQLGAGRVRSPSDVLKLGEELTVRIISIDPSARRISLSRLDPRGALIGSDDAVDGAEIDAVIESGRESLGTNLGSLFAAIKKKDA
jgi:small subunit ribosomal protein S1